MSAVPVWTCEFGAAAGGDSIEHLTVGEPFRMICHGDIAVPWTADVPTVRMPKTDQDFTLNVLSAEKLDPHSVQLTVTGYRPGDHAPDFVRIVQGERGFEVEKPKWKIESVIQGNEKTPEPYASEGFWGLLPPAWLVFALLLTIVAGVIALVLGIRRGYARRRFKGELRRVETPLAPSRQFYRDARLLRRRLNQTSAATDLPVLVTELNTNVRTLVMRRFKTPALTQSDARTIKVVARRRGSDEALPLLRKVLRELTRARARASIEVADVDQLLRMSVDLAEVLERGDR